MKMTKFFAAALPALVLLASCSNEKGGNNRNEEGAGTYLGVSMKFAKTRADAPEVSKGWEDEINEVGVYVVGPTTFDYTVMTVTADGSGGYDADATLKTTTGAKDVYLIVNPTDEIKTKIDAMRRAAFGPNGLNLDEAYYMVVDEYMVMTDSKLSYTVPMQSSTQAKANPLEFKIVRKVAQVVVNTKLGFSAADVLDGAITDLQFALDVKANDAYLPIKSTTLFDPLPTSAKTNDSDPYYSNFSGITSYQAVNQQTADRADLADANSFYCHENYMTLNADKRIGNTTVARIKGVFTPTTVVAGYAADALPKKGVITAGTGVAGATFYVLRADNTYWSEAAYTAALADGFIATDFSAPYTNGVGYYKIYVKDEDGSAGVLANNFYELTISKITGPGTPAVDGDPNDPNYPPTNEDPIEEDTFISFNVTLQPWNHQGSSTELQ